MALSQDPKIPGTSANSPHRGDATEVGDGDTSVDGSRLVKSAEGDDLVTRAVTSDRVGAIDVSIFGALASPAPSPAAVAIDRFEPVPASMTPPVALVLDHAEQFDNREDLDVVSALASRLPTSSVSRVAKAEVTSGSSASGTTSATWPSSLATVNPHADHGSDDGVAGEHHQEPSNDPADPAPPGPRGGGFRAAPRLPSSRHPRRAPARGGS